VVLIKFILRLVVKNIARFKGGGGKTINSKTRAMQKVFWNYKV
jgi:hypothetical protein